jgi:hypothetical protein
MGTSINNKIRELYNEYVQIQMERHAFSPSGEQLNDLHKLLPYTRKMSMDEIKREAITCLTLDEFKQYLNL